jgi:hypothetical protein
MGKQIWANKFARFRDRLSQSPFHPRGLRISMSYLRLTGRFYKITGIS